MKLEQGTVFRIEKFQQGISKRTRQLKDLEHWLNTREGYRIQVNFCIPNDNDHCTVTLSGTAAENLAANTLFFLQQQIEFMKDILNDNIQYGKRNERTKH